MSEPVTPETAVRRYLAWCENPGSAVDQEAVDEAESRFAEAVDPLDRLHAAAARERARTADIAAIRADFVSHARRYADEEGIPVEAFRSVGVDDDVLAEAGFAVPSSRGRRGPAASAGRATPSRPRAPQVSAAQIREVVPAMDGPFTLAQLAERAGGGSPATVRKAVLDLVAEGRATDLGPDPDHAGPGRAPNRYQTT